MKMLPFLLSSCVLVTAMVSPAETIIGGALGNGNFNATGASGTEVYAQTPLWFNAKGSESENFVFTNQTAGSTDSNPATPAGFPFPGRVPVNSIGYLIAEAGEIFTLSFEFGAGGNGWDAANGLDEVLETFLFTVAPGDAVDGDLGTADFVETLGLVSTRVTNNPQWKALSVSEFYTSTASDIGKTVYLGMEFKNPTGVNVFPRIDNVQLDVLPTPAPTLSGWQKFVQDYGLSGDKLADSDGDGQGDVLEFFHGGDPTDPMIQGIEPSIEKEADGAVVFTTTEADLATSGIPYVAEYSESLASDEWFNDWNEEISTPSSSAEYNSVERRLTGSERRRMFCRVKLFDPPSRPNILVVLTDDLGYADVGFNGSPDIRTPNLDELAQGGTKFTSAYVVHPFCGPSRMGLMSGRYPHLFGTPFNLPDISRQAYADEGIPASETLMSKVLQDSGYFTGLMGKWHLGGKSEHHPNARGFDDFYGFLGGGKNYFGPYREQTGTRFSYTVYPERNGADDTSLTSADYMTDVLTAEGVRFVDEAKTKEEPFFLIMSYNAPHTPLEAKQEDMDQFPNLTGDRKTYAGMVYAVDRGVGEIVGALKANGQYENTLIVFLSDNGGRTDRGANNSPLRGVKGDATEGGFRVPMFFHWPNVVPGGETYGHPVTALDFYPTFARLAKASVPAGKQLDGKDIWDNFIVNRSARAGEPIYAVRHRIGSSPEGNSDIGIRVDDWKAVRLGTDPWRLYNIAADIGETTDVSSANASVLSSMVTEGKAWSDLHIEPIWFDSFQAGADWVSKEMPHYDAAFSLP